MLEKLVQQGSVNWSTSGQYLESHVKINSVGIGYCDIIGNKAKNSHMVIFCHKATLKQKENEIFNQ